MNLDDLLFDMQVKGYKTILAHPERYTYYSRRRKRYEQLHNAGARFQINILSFTGYFGEEARDSALWFVRNGMIDYLGSDMHNVKHAHIIMDYINFKGRDWTLTEDGYFDGTYGVEINKDQRFRIDASTDGEIELTLLYHCSIEGGDKMYITKFSGKAAASMLYLLQGGNR